MPSTGKIGQPELPRLPPSVLARPLPTAHPVTGHAADMPKSTRMTLSGRLQFKTDWSIYSAMRHQTPVPAPRGRPRSFDTEAAVERAMGVFWSRGYHATALPDLLRATKLSRGSLYAAFGDKHSLFLRALDRYIADALARIDVELAPPGEPIDGLRAYLAGYVDRTSGANGRRGCLLVATAMELAGQDVEVCRRVAGFFKAMEAKLADALSRGEV